MNRSWTFGQRLSLGFGSMVAAIIVIGAVAVFSLRAVIREKDQVITVNTKLLVDSEKLRGFNATKMSMARGFIIAGEERLLDQLNHVREEFTQLLDQMKTSSVTADEKELLAKIEVENLSLNRHQDRVIELAKKKASQEAISEGFRLEVLPAVEVIERSVQSFIKKEEQIMEEVKQSSTRMASFAIGVVNAIVFSGLALAAILAFVLSRLLNRQIGSAVQHIQSSSSELQAAANQQTAGTREQVTSMNEISSTIKELLSTARQISESSQRVAQIASETTSSAKAGDLTVQRAQDAIATIRRQVDLIVAHMLDLGKKSQQIGGILEIINELAEQTNILAINATIEAAGAGEMGKRFVVVADEIRKLSDRVSGSTKEIRTLIDEIRSAVNTTVMATESGSKAVDWGTKQFEEVATLFKQIVTLIETTKEAAREIELSTKQQTTSVEQVNMAITNIAQTAKESETSSTQTLQTVSELATLSQALLRLVQSQRQA